MYYHTYYSELPWTVNTCMYTCIINCKTPACEICVKDYDLVTYMSKFDLAVLISRVYCM